MSSSDWWAKKLGREPAQPQQWSPQQYAQPQQPSSYPATGPQYTGPPPLQQQDMSNVQVTKDNVVALAGKWQGGQGTKTETMRCPECGSGDYFSRANVSGSKVINTASGTMAHAAPHCFDCGYNGLYHQTGAQ